MERRFNGKRKKAIYNQRLYYRNSWLSSVAPVTFYGKEIQWKKKKSNLQSAIILS
nr:MAG TPA: hypothetical protein [Inoviridae sp.]